MADFSADFRAAVAPLSSTIDAFTFSAVFSPAVTEGQPPVVALVSPAEGSALTKQQPIVVDVTDNATLGLHGIFVEYPDYFNLYEVAFDGDPSSLGGRRGAYIVTRELISGGWRYTILRRGGWPSRPRVRVYATDMGSGEVF